MRRSTRTHLVQEVAVMGRDTAFGQRLAELRAERGLSLRRLGELAHFSRGFLWDLEAGKKMPSSATAARLDEVLSAGGQLVALAAPRAAGSALQQVDALRRQVSETITIGGLSPSAVEDWERTAYEHGRATRYRPSPALLANLAADFTELATQLQRRQNASGLRRLTRVTAQMAGLMFLTLIKLDEQDAARAWARVARVAAGEAGDPLTYSWVRAQEAFVHYYAGTYREALAVADHARELAGRQPCVGAVLAAALQARAYGRLAQDEAARTAIGDAETILAALQPDEVIQSAFGYDEAQLRFHEGNALTHLHDTERAWTAQQRALDLYPPTNYLDRTLVHLDRADCLAQDGDLTAAVQHATASLVPLSDDERRGLLTSRGQEILRALPAWAQDTPPAREFRDLLMITVGPEGADP